MNSQIDKIRMKYKVKTRMTIKDEYTKMDIDNNNKIITWELLVP